MVKLSTLVDDVYGLLEGNSLADPRLFDKYRSLIGDVIVSRLVEDDHKPSLRMSNIGRPCLRQLFYEVNGHEGEKLSGQVKVKFAYGHLIEALVIILTEAAGHTVERLQEEISIDGIKGHIDCVIDGVLVDVKSTSPYGFNKFKDGTLLEEGQDPFGYVGQLAGYSKALGIPGAWIAINKVSGEICILHLPKERADDYDIEGRITTVRQAVGAADAPDRHYKDEPDGKSGNRKLSIACSYCPFKFKCYRDSNDGAGLRSFAYSTGVRHLTTVIKTPDVFEIQSNNKKVIN